jgi:hypothetical protein
LARTAHRGRRLLALVFGEGVVKAEKQLVTR